MVVKVCIGSACHLKGSYEVINKLKELIATHQVGEKVNLSASFCLGRCGDGVTVMADDAFLEGVTPDTVERIFVEKILATVK